MDMRLKYMMLTMNYDGKLFALWPIAPRIVRCAGEESNMPNSLLVPPSVKTCNCLDCPFPAIFFPLHVSESWVYASVQAICFAIRSALGMVIIGGGTAEVLRLR